jgi:hypothetical protein
MADLRNTSIGANHRRAIDNFSRFGTRKLVFYTITVYGLSDDVINTLYDLEEDYTAAGTDYPPEWIESPGNIIEAIQRGVQLIAEPYAFGDWEDYNEDPDYNDLTITAMVAADTVLDADGQDNSPVPVNQNSYTVETAILDAIDNFANDGVAVRQAYLYADYIAEDNYALARTRGGSEQGKARMAARIAAGKNAVKRNR